MSRININDLIGASFADGGRGPHAFDCWGLALEVFRRYGATKLPDYRICCHDSERINTYMRIEEPLSFVKVAEPVEPCVVVIRFNTVQFINHAGVYIGNGKMIHTREKTGAAVERIDSTMWRRRIAGFYIPKE